jgi:thiol-disulfide isomerase/thioredoxin
MAVTNRTVLLAALALLASSVGATVRQATNASFDLLLDERPLAIVAFTAPWCGHCQKLEPELEAAASTLTTEGVTVIKVDVTEHRALGRRFKVRAYPEVLIYRKDLASFTKYAGPRSAGAIVRHVRARLGPACPALPDDSAETWIELAEPEASNSMVRHVLAEEALDLAEEDGIVTLEKLERAMEHVRHIVLCATAATAPAGGGSFPVSTRVRVRFARAFGGLPAGRTGAVPPVLRYAGPADETNLLRWLTLHSRPAVSELTHATARMYTGVRDTGVAVLMLPSPLNGRENAQREHYERELGAVYAAVSVTTGVPCFLTFLHSASPLGQQLAGDYGIDPTEPSLVILDFTLRARKPPGHRLTGAFSVPAAIDHVARFKAGEFAAPAGWIDWVSRWLEWVVTLVLDHWVESALGIVAVFVFLFGLSTILESRQHADPLDPLTPIEPSLARPAVE